MRNNILKTFFNLIFYIYKVFEKNANNQISSQYNYLISMLIFNPTLHYNICQGKGTYTYSKIVKNTQFQVEKVLYL